MPISIEPAESYFKVHAIGSRYNNSMSFILYSISRLYRLCDNRNKEFMDINEYKRKLENTINRAKEDDENKIIEICADQLTQVDAPQSKIMQLMSFIILRFFIKV